MKMVVKPKTLFLGGLLLIVLLGLPPMSSALDVGDNAPDFKLLSTTCEKISLSQSL